MSSRPLHIAAILTTVAQLILCAAAIWILENTRQASDRVSMENFDRHFEYTQLATMIPKFMVALFAVNFVAALLWNRPILSRWLFAVLVGLSILVMAAVWLSLARVNLAYATFFVAAGALAPNEIMGAQWPLFLVVMLLTAAALLGLIPLAWLAHRASRAK